MSFLILFPDNNTPDEIKSVLYEVQLVLSTREAAFMDFHDYSKLPILFFIIFKFLNFLIPSHSSNCFIPFSAASF